MPTHQLPQSAVANPGTVFLAWQDAREAGDWFPIGRLDAHPERPAYRFRYTGGAARARSEAGFRLLLDFPELGRDYRAARLFPRFQNRIINPRRNDRREYLKRLALGPDAGPVEILSASGGYRVTDPYEMFPKLAKRADGSFRCRFFLHWRHANPAAQRRLAALAPGELLKVAVDLTDPESRDAVQIQTADNHTIGWTPRYLVPEVAGAMGVEGLRYSASVVRLNPRAPMKQRLFVEMRGSWNGYEPMAGPDYQPVVGD